MDLYHTILAEFYAEYGHLVTNIDAASIIHDRCYQALCQIKAVLEDDTLEDPDCFDKIEEIVTIFEALGSDAGTSHDFG